MYGTGSIIVSIVTVVIAACALVISLVSFYIQRKYAQQEYEYKLDPEIYVDGRMGLEMQVRGDEKDIKLNVPEPTFQILQKNNLQSAYLIHADYTITKLEIDDIENTLETDWKTQMDLNTPNLEMHGVSYHYEFILLEGLDDSIELYLFYVRSGIEPEQFGTYLVSEIELLELEKAHENEEKYAGEKILAEKYREVLMDCEKYMY